MPLYRYRAARLAGGLEKGRRHALTESALASVLRAEGLELIEAVETRENPSAGWGEKWTVLLRGGSRSLTLVQNLELCRQVGTILRTGLPFHLAVREAAEVLPAGPVRTRLREMNAALDQGETVSATCARPPALFDPVACALIQTGEASGNLPEAWEHVIRHLETLLDFRTRVGRAVRYPLFLLVLACVVLGIMQALVVPPVVALVDSLGLALPLATRLLLALAQGVTTYGGWGLIVGVGSIVLVALVRSKIPGVARRVDAGLLSLPALGPLIRAFAGARFAEGLRLMVAGGMDPGDALRVAAATLGNRALALRAHQAAEGLLKGQPLSEATAGLWPPGMERRVRIGEAVGDLLPALREGAAACDEQARAALERFTGFLEPFLTLLVGGMLAFIVLAVLGPVYGSLGALSGSGAP